jgi:hypothetical protein
MKFFLTFLITLFTIPIFGQTTNTAFEDKDNHEDHKNEIGVANAPVYFIKEKVFAYGLHLHFVRSIPKTKFGVGIGYERIFDEHKHNTFGLVGTYQPIEKLTLNVSPGLTFEDGSKANFALHLETSYEFEVKDFHIGPAFEVAYDPEDYHISLGLHIGYGF